MHSDALQGGLPLMAPYTNPPDAARDPGGGAVAAWPAAVFDAPVLRGLDARARREITEAGHLRTLAPGEIVYRAGDGGDAFFVAASGSIGLRVTRRGDEREIELRVV